MQRLLGVAALVAMTMSGAQAQTFPTKPIHLVSAYASGGPTEFLSRTVGEKAALRLGQPVLVEARPGANERIATEYLVRQPADGYTILLVAVPHATNPSLFTLTYDTQKEMTGLIQLVSNTPMITTNPESPYRTMADVIKAAKAAPGELTYGSPGNATGPHLLMEMIGLVTDTQMRHVPFKGDAPALTELLGNRISVSANAMISGINYVKSGRLRALGVSSRERSPILPDVPTLVEQGMTDSVVNGWFGLVMRSATPRPIINRLNADFDAALKLPEVREKILANGLTPVGGTPEQFTALIRDDTARWAKVIKTRGIKAE
jgi:tripartite-type tricarboxylate transporter receptor subunit TctC